MAALAVHAHVLHLRAPNAPTSTPGFAAAGGGCELPWPGLSVAVAGQHSGSRAHLATALEHVLKVAEHVLKQESPQGGALVRPLVLIIGEDMAGS